MGRTCHIPIGLAVLLISLTPNPAQGHHPRFGASNPSGQFVQPGLVPGTGGLLQLRCDWSVSYGRLSHGVSADQAERDPATGLVRPVQADEHRLANLLVNFDLSAQLWVLDWFVIRLRVPIRVVRTQPSFRRAGVQLQGFQSMHHRRETLAGIGDVELWTRFRPVRPGRHKGWTIELGAGVSFPSGGIEPNPYLRSEAGEAHQHIFFGTGTVNPLAALIVGRRFAKFSLALSADVRAAAYKNRHGYRAGLETSAAIAAESGFGLARWSFMLAVGAFHQQPGTWLGTHTSEEAGRTDLVIGAGAGWRVHRSWMLRLLLRIPVTLRSVGSVRTFIVATLGVEASFKVF